MGECKSQVYAAMRQKGPKLGKRKTPYNNGAIGDALRNKNGSTHKETRMENERKENKDAVICPGSNTKG